MSKFVLSNGWKVWKENTDCFLEVFPIQGTVFVKYYIVPIPPKIYQEIESGIFDVKILSQKHKLFSHAIQWENSESNITNIENKKQNNPGWFLTEINDIYFINFQSSLQGSPTITKEISKEIYHEIRNCKLSLKDILNQYNLI